VYYDPLIFLGRKALKAFAQMPLPGV